MNYRLNSIQTKSNNLTLEIIPLNKKINPLEKDLTFGGCKCDNKFRCDCNAECSCDAECKHCRCVDLNRCKCDSEYTSYPSEPGCYHDY